VLLHLLYDRRFHGGRRRLDEFALLLELSEKFFAGYAELFRKLVYA